MSSRGVFFAISDAQAKKLLQASESDDDEKVLELVEEIEEAWNEDLLQEVDKAWDAMARIFGDGTLDDEAGAYPLNGGVLGCTALLAETEDYYVGYKNKQQVKDIATAMASLEESWF